MRYSFYSLNKKCNSDGLSLVSTLWIISILSVLAMQLLYSFELESKARNNFADRVKYHYAAKSGFELGLIALRTDETNFDSLGEVWAEPIQQQVEDRIQMGKQLSFQVSITDEASRIDLNSAQEDTIRNLLSFLGVQPEMNETGDLATRIVEGRPFRSVRDVARIEGMTEQILYGIQPQIESTSGSPPIVEPPVPDLTQAPPPTDPTHASDTQPTPQSSGGLIAYTTIYSTDRNTDSEGQQRVNINTANAQQIQGIQGNNNQSVFTQAEANAIIQARDFDGISGILDVQAVSDNVFNNIRDRLTTQGNNNDDNRVNINSADADELEELQGIDSGIAQRIVAYRNAQGDFANIDAIKNVPVTFVQQFIEIVDKITTTDDSTISGLININTAPIEVLALLPGMDNQKAQAIITRRNENPEEQSDPENPVQGNPFSNLGDLLDIEEIDNQTFREVVNWITYRSHGYRIQSSGIDRSGKTTAVCEGIVIRTQNQLQIPYWRID
ncbi:helix-hairpin-helix domain-containing protein [Candidatus Poribacteria bacterium]|nr:helix-hairpin-helix domain-containing protein [Candidatus Poribacteria bacterium]